MKLLLFRTVLFLAFVQHSIAWRKELFIASRRSDDIRIIADIVKNYVIKSLGNNHITVSFKFTATTVDQMHKQFDLMQEVLTISKDLNVTYTFLDLDICPYQIRDFRSLNVLLVDSGHTFW